jgi:indolepyruvate ferredoxin oxidoreductase, beta subunit
MRETTSLFLVGVGGQGTVLVTTILSKGLVAAGYDVKMAEVHGMSQRGGSVSTQVRYGNTVYSPIVGRGGADALVAFETMEALRWIEYLKPGGKVIVNDYRIASAPILMGQRDYPDNVLDILKACADTRVIEASDIAVRIGNPRVMNLVLFGALVESAALSAIDWEPVIRASVKPAFVEMNLAAFRAGRNAVSPGEPAKLARKTGRSKKIVKESK